MLQLSETEFLDLATRYNIVPVSKKIQADSRSPVALFASFQEGSFSYLLESAEQDGKIGRYSFIGLDYYEVIKFQEGLLTRSKPASADSMPGQTDCHSYSGTSSSPSSPDFSGFPGSHGSPGSPGSTGSRSFSGSPGSSGSPETYFSLKTDQPLEALQEILKEYQGPQLDDLPLFYGGAVGYLSYDMAGYFENVANPAQRDDLEMPEMLYILSDSVIIYDHLEKTIKIVKNIKTTGQNSRELQENYRQAKKYLEDISDRIRAATRKPGALNSIKSFSEEKFSADKTQNNILQKRHNKQNKQNKQNKHNRQNSQIKQNRQNRQNKQNRHNSQIKQNRYNKHDNYYDNDEDTDAGTIDFTSSMSSSLFKARVRQIKDHIARGDIFQAVLSQRLSLPTSASGFEIYQKLRRINPSPYMYYLDLGEFEIIGSSPEVLVRVEDGVVYNRPLAGTRKRGKDQAEDESLARDLKQDRKERAEHMMLVDLGRNDVGRVSSYGTVQVEELMGVEYYSHVMHLFSSITGKLRPDSTPFQALEACFPAGTVSGAPKIKAMEIINRLEPFRRGPYAGSLGYFGYSGNLDSCITIRTILLQNETAHVQAGAGIVHDSQPEKEYQETLDKAEALLQAVREAGGERK